MAPLCSLLEMSVCRALGGSKAGFAETRTGPVGRFQLTVPRGSNQALVCAFLFPPHVPKLCLCHQHPTPRPAGHPLTLVQAGHLRLHEMMTHALDFGPALSHGTRTPDQSLRAPPLVSSQFQVPGGALEELFVSLEELFASPSFSCLWCGFLMPSVKWCLGYLLKVNS